MSERCWYVIQCKAKESFRAAENLQNQGFEVFHPNIEVERLRAGRIKLINEPLFPYYLFIHLSDTTDNWRPIRSTRGVLKMLSFGTTPLKVPDQLIEALKCRVQPATEILFKTGDEVLIDEGPLKGLKAVFETKKGEERVILLLNLLQKQQRIEVATRAVRPL